MLNPFPYLLFAFCTSSLASVAKNAGPHAPIRFSQIAIEQMIRDSIPETKSSGEIKENEIKQVPKARKQVRPQELRKEPAVKTLPNVKTVIKPVIKPAIKPVIKPVIHIN